MPAGGSDSAVEHEPPGWVVKKRLARCKRADAQCEGSSGIFDHLDSRDRPGALPEIGSGPGARLMGGEIEEHAGIELLRRLSHEDCELSDAGSGAGTIGMSEEDQ